jgi:hypothetical protein
MNAHPDKLGVLNAMDDPTHRAMLEEMIGRMRMAVAPMLNDALGDATDDRFKLTQSMMISAAATFAGLTVGHMVAVGGMKPHDKGRAAKVVTVAFRNGIKLGEQEARKAMLEQRGCAGSA